MEMLFHKQVAHVCDGLDLTRRQEWSTRCTCGWRSPGYGVGHRETAQQQRNAQLDARNAFDSHAYTHGVDALPSLAVYRLLTEWGAPRAYEFVRWELEVYPKDFNPSDGGPSTSSG